MKVMAGAGGGPVHGAGVACVVILMLVGCLGASVPEASRYGRLAHAEYRLSPEQVQDFKEKGLAVLEDALREEEVAALEAVYDQFMRREITVPGKDFCDMSKPFGTAFEDFSIVNCMLPTTYHPPLAGNVYERIAEGICRQLFPDAEMVKDYDQFLNKKPCKTDAVFAWHQDMAYWPPPRLTPDTRTVTFSLAIDRTTRQNGCLRYLPGSGKAKLLRKHKPLCGTRDNGHAVTAQVSDTDPIEFAEVPRGAITIHDEYVVHGSGGNDSNGERRTYVVAFRPKETVATERKLGFTHSHNDRVNWDTFEHIRGGAAPAEGAQEHRAPSGELVPLAEDSQWGEHIELAKANGVPLVVQFSASWCGPCQRIAPKFKALAKEYPHAIFVKVDVDDMPETAAEQEISAMPTFKVLKSGEVVGVMLGANEEKLAAFLRSSLA